VITTRMSGPDTYTEISPNGEGKSPDGKCKTHFRLFTKYWSH